MEKFVNNGEAIAINLKLSGVITQRALNRWKMIENRLSGVITQRALNRWKMIENRFLDDVYLLIGNGENG